MGKLIDLTGQKFNMLTAVKLVGKNKSGAYIWLFRCDCGNEKEIRGDVVKNGSVKSCGCLRKTRWEGIRKMHKNNTTGNSGVYFDKREKKFRARLMYNKKIFQSGYYEDYGLALFLRKSLENYAKLKPTLEDFSKYAAQVREEIKQEIILAEKLWED